MQSGYEMTNEELLQRFASICRLVGTSGIVIDPLGPYEEDERYLEGVLLSRLEGKKPPFTCGKKVSCTTPCYYHPHRIEAGQKLTVQRVWYKGEGVWELEFEEIPKDNQDNLSCFSSNAFAA